MSRFKGIGDTASDEVSLLTHDVALATKRWYLQGGVQCEPYGSGKWFAHSTYPVCGVESLYSLLYGLEIEYHTFAIRGALARGVSGERVRRTCTAREGLPAQFIETPRRWMMLDLDGLDAPDVPAAITLLPECLHGVTCVVQHSSSAGFRPGLRGHLWYWLDRPVGERDLRAWAAAVNDRAGRKIIDPSVFGTVQPHYTAGPYIEEGVVDPMFGRPRVYLLEGTRGAVSLPIDVAVGRDWRAALRRLHDPRNVGIHDAIRDAAGAYFLTQGAAADETVLREALTEAIEIASELQHRSDYGQAEVEKEITDGREYARGRGELGGDLQLSQSGQPLANAHNLSVLFSGPDWAGALGYDERSLRYRILRDPPYAQPQPCPRDVVDADGSWAAAWCNRVHQCQASPVQAYETLITTARRHPFDPVREYLSGLLWDGRARIGDVLVRYFGADDSPYVRRVGEILLLGAVARTLSPGCDMQTLTILEGRQGAGKSRGLRALFGASFFKDDLIAGVDSKDSKLALHGPWAIEIPEIDRYFARRGSDQDLKGYISCAVDSFRAPYGRADEAHPRRCVLVGTSNESQYLTDPSGGRRYHPVRVVRSVRVDEIARDRDQIWAEAVVRYHAGATWWTDAGEADFVAAQSERRVVDPWEDAIQLAVRAGVNRRFAGGGEIPAGATELSAQQIWRLILDVRTPTSADGRRLSAVMRALGWDVSRSHGGTVYRAP